MFNLEREAAQQTTNLTFNSDDSTLMSISLLEWKKIIHQSTWFRLVSSAGRNVANVCQDNLTVGQMLRNQLRCLSITIQLHPVPTVADQSYLQQLLQSIGESAKTKHRQIDRCNDDRQRIVGRTKEEETIPRLYIVIVPVCPMIKFSSRPPSVPF